MKSGEWLQPWLLLCVASIRINNLVMRLANMYIYIYRHLQALLFKRKACLPHPYQELRSKTKRSLSVALQVASRTSCWIHTEEQNKALCGSQLQFLLQISRRRSSLQFLTQIRQQVNQVNLRWWHHYKMRHQRCQLRERAEVRNNHYNWYHKTYHLVKTPFGGYQP